MQSEGPYEHKKYPIAGGGKKHSHLCPACAYAEGRKAAENDFEVLLEFTNCVAQMLKEIWAVYVPSHDPSFLVKFTAWKKARGIE